MESDDELLIEEDTIFQELINDFIKKFAKYNNNLKHLASPLISFVEEYVKIYLYIIYTLIIIILIICLLILFLVFKIYVKVGS